MNEYIANMIIELARYACIAFCVRQARFVMNNWIDKIQKQPSKEDVIDMTRQYGLEIADTVRQ